MQPLEGAQHIVFTPTARGSSCVWTGERITEETLAILMAEPEQPVHRVSMSLGGLSEMTVAHQTKEPASREAAYELSPSGHVVYDPSDNSVYTCVECLEKISSSEPVVVFQQHTTGGHKTNSAVHCHPSCVPELCERLSAVWDYTDEFIGDLL